MLTPDFTSPAYHQSLERLQKLFAAYNWDMELLTKENFERLKQSKYWDSEEDDDPNLLIGTHFIPKILTSLGIGRGCFWIRSVWLDTDHDWYCWNLSMVCTKTKRWHFMDVRLLYDPLEIE